MISWDSRWRLLGCDVRVGTLRFEVRTAQAMLVSVDVSILVSCSGVVDFGNVSVFGNILGLLIMSSGPRLITSHASRRVQTRLAGTRLHTILW